MASMKGHVSLYSLTSQGEDSFSYVLAFVLSLLLCNYMWCCGGRCLLH